MTLRQIPQKFQGLKWFNSIDFGDFSVIGREGPDFRHPNLSLYSAMELLNGVDLRGKRCLEIGPGSGLISIAMKKMGAEYVAAVDGFDVPTFRAAVEMSGQEVDYFTDGLEGIKARTRWIDGFDFVFSAGLMYHLINPFLLIETAKMVLKDGGVFLLQSMTAKEDNKAGMYLNTRVSVNGDRTTFTVPTPSAMQGLMDLGLFSRLAEAKVVQQDNFYAILGRSMTSTKDMRDLRAQEKQWLGSFEDDPSYPYGGYDFADFIRPKLKSDISTRFDGLNEKQVIEIDLTKQKPPSIPFQPLPRSPG